MSGQKTFHLTDDHIKLLRASYTTWYSCEYGAAAIDPKRPYGSSGDYERQIAAVLGLKPVTVKQDDGPIYTDEQERYCSKVHAGTQTALQIILFTGEFKSGVYQEKTPYAVREWEYVGPLPEEDKGK